MARAGGSGAPQTREPEQHLCRENGSRISDAPLRAYALTLHRIRETKSTLRALRRARETNLAISSAPTCAKPKRLRFGEGRPHPGHEHHLPELVSIGATLKLCGASPRCHFSHMVV
jgi:hypothetical protein